MNEMTRFVTFSLGEGRYALDSCRVKEVVMPSRVYSFPHTMESLQGVLMRHGGVIPVCDLGRAFGQCAKPSLYLVAECNYAGRAETVAIPLMGGCELVQGDPFEGEEEVPFGAGLLGTKGMTVPLLDLDRVVAHCIRPSNALAGEAQR